MKSLLSDKVIELLKFRMKEELKASAIYRSMYVWLNFKGYVGSAKFYLKWSDEEREHYKKAESYLLDRNIMPCVPMQEEIDPTYESLEQILQLTLEQEILVEDQCKELYLAAFKEGDFTTADFSQFYLKEQVEELDKIIGLNDRYKLCKNNEAAILMFDQELGSY